MHLSAFTLVGISILFCCVSSGIINVTDCGSQDATIVSVDVSGCTTQPCTLKKGANTTITMVFTPKKNISAANNLAYGYIGPIKTPYPLNDNNACHFMKCPLVAGTNVTYSTEVFVQQAYPSISLQIEWQLQDASDSSMITCFRVMGTIKA